MFYVFLTQFYIKGSNLQCGYLLDIIKTTVNDKILPIYNFSQLIHDNFNSNFDKKLCKVNYLHVIFLCN